jgi:hypothetical protein
MAESFDPKELKRLSPEERLKRLKALEEERKKELVEADKLIKESIVELEEAVQVRERPPEPQQTGRIPEPESESALERQVRKEEPAGDVKQGVQYAINLYGELAEAREAGQGYDTRMRAVDLYERIKQQEQYMSQDSTVKHIAEGSRRIMRELFGEYRSNQDYLP